ncbi:TonB family protein [Sulfuricurvum sp.]|uniref:energy transducer TonB n=1 Tax=Sulfuricurvum sp. TaxID=2025608 RepID=UPI00286DEADA|nr:TonB family protein [Sulfuricurvum sp.]
MKNSRSFGLSILLHAGIITGAIALSNIPKEKEEDIVLELSLSSPVNENQPQSVNQPSALKKSSAAKQTTTQSASKIIENVETEPLIEKRDLVQTVNNESALNPKTVETVPINTSTSSQPTVMASLPTPLSEPINIEEQYLEDHLSTIRNILVKYRKYPSQAVRLKQEGGVKVTFRLKQNGEVEDVRIVGSSGYDILDEDAIALIQKSAEYFPKPPKAVRITVPLNYALKNRA